MWKSTTASWLSRWNRPAMPQHLTKRKRRYGRNETSNLAVVAAQEFDIVSGLADAAVGGTRGVSGSGRSGARDRRERAGGRSTARFERGSAHGRRFVHHRYPRANSEDFASR